MQSKLPCDLILGFLKKKTETCTVIFKCWILKLEIDNPKSGFIRYSDDLDLCHITSVYTLNIIWDGFRCTFSFYCCINIDRCCLENIQLGYKKKRFTPVMRRRNWKSSRGRKTEYSVHWTVMSRRIKLNIWNVGGRLHTRWIVGH